MITLAGKIAIVLGFFLCFVPIMCWYQSPELTSMQQIFIKHWPWSLAGIACSAIGYSLILRR